MGYIIKRYELRKNWTKNKIHGKMVKHFNMILNNIKSSPPIFTKALGQTSIITTIDNTYIGKNL